MLGEYYTVTVPVVNLRGSPAEGAPSYARDDLLLSQLLFGEKMLVKDESDGWVFVEAPEQATFRIHGRWEGYSGWVRKDSILPSQVGGEGTRAVVRTRTAPVLRTPVVGSRILFELSLGSTVGTGEAPRKDGRFVPVRVQQGETGWIDKDRLRMVGDTSAGDPDRENILAAALLFLGTPYLWGGRSMYMPNLKTVATGVDCSGLINLVYRAHGIDVPRDAQEQSMKAEPAPARELKPGDLVFVARGENPVSHVMLFTGGEGLIEAHETGAGVRMTTFTDRFGVHPVRLARAQTGVRLEDGRVVSFGRFL